jgi:predicted N-acetyltransferase YhbS
VITGPGVCTFGHETWQRRGAGARLLEELERSARLAGVEELRVEGRVSGAGFYERRGYERTGATLAGSAGPQISLTERIVHRLPANAEGDARTSHRRRVRAS